MPDRRLVERFRSAMDSRYGTDAAHGMLAEVCAEVGEHLIEETRRLVLRAPRASDLIRNERHYQLEKSFTVEHDRAMHNFEVLMDAAWCYANVASECAPGLPGVPIRDSGQSGKPERWPWSAEEWKPSHTVRNLVRAGGLYQAAAEMATHPHQQSEAIAARNAVEARIDELLEEGQRALEAALGERDG